MTHLEQRGSIAIPPYASTNTVSLLAIILRKVIVIIALRLIENEKILTCNKQTVN